MRGSQAHREHAVVGADGVSPALSDALDSRALMHAALAPSSSRKTLACRHKHAVSDQSDGGYATRTPRCEAVGEARADAHQLARRTSDVRGPVT